MAVSISNTDSNLSGNTVVLEEQAATITGAYTFDRDPSAPFAVTANSAVVTNLDADKLDGQHGTYYTSADNLSSGTIPQARLGAPQDIGLCEGRLTLTTATPITTSDVTAAGTIYFTPYKGNRIALYDGSSAWTVYAFTELSLALTATSGKPYDVFIYDNSGVPTLETLVWTNDTTRATALTTQNGILVLTGSTTRRYVGTFYASGTNQTEDSYAKRYVWNYYNRVRRPMRVLEATNTWTYTTATYRQANGSTANQLDMVIGVNEVPLAAQVTAIAENSSGNVQFRAAIGLDSTSAVATGSVTGTARPTTAGHRATATASLRTFPGVGRHFAAWLEHSAATGTTTWIGDDGGTTDQTGIHGEIEG